MPKKFIDRVGDEGLIDQIEQTFETAFFSTSFDEMNYEKVVKAFTDRSTNVYIVDYSLAFTLHFKQHNGQTDEEFEQSVAFMYESYKKQYGRSSVTREGDHISIKSDKQLLIIEMEDEEMKMLEFQKGMRPIYEVVLSKELSDVLFE